MYIHVYIYIYVYYIYIYIYIEQQRLLPRQTSLDAGKAAPDLPRLRIGEVEPMSKCSYGSNDDCRNNRNTNKNKDKKKISIKQSLSLSSS